MDGGNLVPDTLILAMIEDRLSQPDVHAGWILDGFPRTVDQAQELDLLLEKMGQSCDRIISLSVPDAVLVERLLSRGQAEGRSDDNEAVVQRRLAVFHEQTRPVLDFYGDRPQLATINGDAALTAVTEAIQQAVKQTATTP
jgi:adenylate kinase